MSIKHHFEDSLCLLKMNVEFEGWGCIYERFMQMCHDNTWFMQISTLLSRTM